MSTSYRSVSSTIAGYNFGWRDSTTSDSQQLFDATPESTGVMGTIWNHKAGSPIKGDLTLPTGHGLIDGNFDVYWYNSATETYGWASKVAGVFTGDVLELTSNDDMGDALPADDADNDPLEMIVCPITEYDTAVSIDGDQVVAYAGQITNYRAMFTLEDAGGNHIIFKLIPGSGVQWVTGDSTNPLASFVAVALHISTAAQGLLTVPEVAEPVVVGFAYDLATP